MLKKLPIVAATICLRSYGRRLAGLVDQAQHHV